MTAGSLTTLTDWFTLRTKVASTMTADAPVTSMPLRSVGLQPSIANRTR